MLLRMTGLGLAIGHGWGKVVALTSGQGQRLIEGVAELGFPNPTVFAWAAALSECLGGVCLALGLATRVAAAFAAFTMAVAAFVRHHAHLYFLGALGFSTITEQNREDWGNPESALVYLAALLAAQLLGPGRISLDFLIFRSRRR